jgi:hypothetical protein
MVNQERHGVNPLRGSGRQNIAEAKKHSFISYDQKKIGLMDLPHLMGNASHCPQGAWTTLRVAHNSTSPNSNEGVFIISYRNERERPRDLQGRRRNLTPIGAFWVKAIVRLDILSWVAVQKLERNGLSYT